MADLQAADAFHQVVASATEKRMCLDDHATSYDRRDLTVCRGIVALRDLKPDVVEITLRSRDRRKGITLPKTARQPDGQDRAA